MNHLIPMPHAVGGFWSQLNLIRPDDVHRVMMLLDVEGEEKEIVEGGTGLTWTSYPTIHHVCHLVDRNHTLTRGYTL
jgi:hypothetical protein